ncbi:NAC domain-containing protein 30-like [Magnolia sinica]|uniref:NAC domain-containing protein 30-like n=1 Tax=Magnolia sinica TaxID=86752 RepID=UPI00265B0DFF|nr:NAC domain-containing protein 30-like [Magnolia sinica]
MATNEHSYSSSSLQGPSSSSPILQVQLPPGFHFIPHDWQLIMHYLFCRTHELEPPEDINIPEINIYDHLPDDLKRNFYYGFEGDMYFYTRRKFIGERVERLVAGGRGFWKNTGKDDNIKISKDIVGIKKAFAYREENGKHATGWQMQEYRLKNTEADDVVLYKIYKN